MAILNQDSSSTRFYMGWYGNCAETCSDLDISQLTGSENILRIFQYADENTAGDQLRSYTGLFNQFTTLQCGKMYLVILKSGTGSVTIPNFIATDISAADLGRVTDNC